MCLIYEEFDSFDKEMVKHSSAIIQEKGWSYEYCTKYMVCSLISLLHIPPFVEGLNIEKGYYDFK